MFFKFALTLLGLLFGLTALAQDFSLKGFESRFELIKNTEGRVTHIKLKRATTKFTLKPFFTQIKLDLLGEQQSMLALSESERDQEFNEMFQSMGIDLSTKSGQQEAQAFKDSILNIKNIDIEDAFAQIDDQEFWSEFETKLNEALNFIDPTILVNLEDPRFFYKKAVTHKVVVWALEQAQKRFSQIPFLNIATFVIVRVHDMMVEQRHFHHNMLLYYFEKVKETELGMTKEEVDRAVSSIYEFRIDPTNFFESSNAAADWLNYGMNKFYMMVRSGNMTVREWSGPFQTYPFKNVKKINFGFAEVTENDVRKIYHLHTPSHMFTMKPSLAYDFSKPLRIKNNRALMNIGSVALGFLKLPAWLRSSALQFIRSMYVQQVRLEGALVGYFDSTGNTQMRKAIFAQRSNLYIVE
jgi:hypothetical protein